MLLCVFFHCQEQDITLLSEELSTLSLNSIARVGITPGVKRKLEELVKARNIMKFNSRPNRTDASSFCPEEIALLQNIPQGRLFHSAVCT